MYLVQTSDYCWGKGVTLNGALQACRAAGSKVTKASRTVDYVVFAFSDNVKPESVYVDGMGSARWEVKVAEEPHNFRQGLVNQWMWRDRENTSLMTDE
jgi:hypothetical protein